MTGTYGTNGVPTGSPLATSDDFDVSTLTETMQLKSFTFTGAQRYEMVADTYYVIVFENPTSGTIDGSNYVCIGADVSIPLDHAGNYVKFSSSSWSGSAVYDVIFYVCAVRSIYTRIINIEVGESDSNYSDITNVKSIRWRRVHTITPRLLPSTKVPVGYLQSHSWLEGQLITVGKTDVFDSYYTDTTDSTVIPYFVVTAEKHDLSTATFTFNNLIIVSTELPLEEGEPVKTYNFLAYSLTEV